MRKTTGAVLLLMCLLIPCLAGAAVLERSDPISGTVRVCLASLGSPAEVTATLDGSYTLEGDLSRVFARGTRIRVVNRSGKLELTGGGQSISAAGIRLQRHVTSGTNGVRFDAARVPENLYPGDVEFRAKGGNVQVIVHVYIEDYLEGVVPYELDDSFPLEALKAQSVAARTYALRKMGQQAAAYDLVDTTSDQVYNGSPEGKDNCRRAIRETAGVVGLVGGEYMAAYYTASNGGQTESVLNAWGSRSAAYMIVKDDPYDLRNPAAPARYVTFYTDGTTGEPALTSLLRDEAARISGERSGIRQITEVTLSSPRYPEPSRVFRKVQVACVLASGTPVVVTLDYFDQVEPLCNLSINALDNEVQTVTQTVGGFRLTARRFGHGVGMSQRGAQQMAQEGLGVEDILSFYYPGITLTRFAMTRSLAASIDGTLSQEEFGEDRIVTITLENPLSRMNLRSEASQISGILASIPSGTQVTLLSSGEEWSRIQYGTLSGFALTKYLKEPRAEDLLPGIGEAAAVVTLSDDSQMLNIRLTPGMTGAVIGGLRNGQRVAVTGIVGSWTQIRAGDRSGYVMSSYLTAETKTLAGEPEEIPQDAQMVPMSGARAVVLPSEGIGLYLQPSSSSGIRMHLPQGAKLRVEEGNDSMLKAALGGMEGYLERIYIYLITAEDAASVISRPAVVTSRDGLMLRREPSSSSDATLVLPYGAGVTVTGEETDGFVPVTFGSNSGYAAIRYLSMDTTPLERSQPAAAETSATPVPAASGYVTVRRGVVTARNGVNLRESPSRNSSVLAVLPRGAQVVAAGSSNGFAQVTYGELSGYVSEEYLSFSEGSPVAEEPPAASGAPEATESLPAGNVSLQETGAPVPAAAAPAQEAAAGEPGSGSQETGTRSGMRVIVGSSNGLNLREAASSASEVLCVLPYGTILTVLGEDGSEYLHVSWAGMEGYVSGKYVRPLN